MLALRRDDHLFAFYEAVHRRNVEAVAGKIGGPPGV
jgi:hypothetical protein